MITFRVSTEVKEDHRVELTLPADIPTGKADLVVSVSPHAAEPPRRPRTSLADWAEQHAEHWGDKLDSGAVEAFTGRRF
jgi:hypothetical protein